MMKRSRAMVNLALVFALCLGFASALFMSTPSALPPALGADSNTAGASPAQEDETWEQVFHEPFDNFPGDGWTVEGDAAGADIRWGRTTDQADVGRNPESGASAWVAAGGADGLDASSGNYPNNMQTQMVYGPLDLSSVKGALVSFTLYHDIEGPEGEEPPPPEEEELPPPEEEGSKSLALASETALSGDWFGFCILDSTTYATYDVYNDPEHKCDWYQGYSEDMWYYEEFSLHDYIGQDDVYLAWVFTSDESNRKANAGAFVDEVEIWTTANEEQKDPTKDGFHAWETIYEQSFDGVDFATDPNWTRTEEMGTVQWDTVTDWNDSDANPESAAAAAPVPVGSGYPTNLHNWLIYGPIDLTNYQSASVEFSLWYDLFLSDTGGDSDWAGFCMGPTNDPQHFHDENCDWWSGENGGWETITYDANPFAGQSGIYLAWAFESNVGSSTKAGVLIDEISVEADPGGQEEQITYENDGLLLQNSSFNNGIDHWSYANLSSTKTGSATVKDGIAQLSDYVYFYQPFTVDDTVTDLTVEFEYAFKTSETEQWTDFNCLSITSSDDLGTRLVDLGCWDATVMPTRARDGKQFDKVEISLDDDELDAIRGLSVALVFEQEQDNGNEGSGPTITVLDNVVIYATSNAFGEDGKRQLAQPRDPHEPNDEFDDATPIRCGETLSGVFGDVGGGHDEDIFKISRVPVGHMVLDVDAQSLQPPSKADTYMMVYDELGETVVAENDDDGKTLDSKITYEITSEGQTFYVHLQSVREPGPEQFYNLTIKCAETNAETGSEATNNTRDDEVDAANRKAWTMMLYLNAEDQTSDWTMWYDASRTAMEAFIADKQDFINVIILMDGPNNDDVLRYVVQPDGMYTDNVNRWQLDEINMGDPETLSDFVKWSMSRYPADHYYLAIEDHGHGILGISADYHDGESSEAELDYMTTSELRSALKEATRNGKHKIDIVDYVACLMGMVENAYDVKDYANYLAFYQSISWTADKYSEAFADIQEEDSVRTVAERIIATEPVTSSLSPYTYSLIDTSKMDDLRRKIDTFAIALQQADLSEVWAARNETQAFNGQLEKGDATQDSYGYLDLWDFADKVASRNIAVAEANALKKAIDSVVVAQKAVTEGQSSYTDDYLWDYSNYHGLSILYPLRSYTFMEDYLDSYQMSRDGVWDNFLVAALAVSPLLDQDTTLQNNVGRRRVQGAFVLESIRLLGESPDEILNDDTGDDEDNDQSMDALIVVYLPLVLGE